MFKRIFLLLAAGIASIALADRVYAGPPDAAPAPAVRTTENTIDTFQRGTFDFEVMSGTLLSIQHTSASRPNFDYGLAVLRLGYLLDSPHGHGFLEGNNEVMLEALGGPVYTGPGSVLGGLTLIYRRNFMAPGARLVPYLDLGAGGIYTDAFHQHVQKVLGSPFEFNLGGSVGLRFRIAGHWSLDGEANFRHFSNAGLGHRNSGINSLGGLVGVGYAF